MTSFVRLPRIQRTASRLLLLLLVITLSFAWLPQPAAAQSVKAPTDTLFAAFIINNTLWVYGTGFTALEKLQVRVRILDDDPWLKIGSVKANMKGKFSKILELPTSMARATSLQVCVKNIATGKSRCTTARHASP